MKRQNILLIIYSLMLLSGCNPIVKLIYGVKKPRPESVESLAGFLNQIGTSADNFYYCKDSNSFIKIMKSNPGIPDAEFYDCNGNFIPYRITSEGCNAGIDSFINQLMSKKTVATGFESINSRLVYFIDAQQKTAISLNSIPKSDYYVIIYFTKYSGKKLNKDHINIWVDEINKLNKESALKMTYLLVSLDFMDFWGYDLSDMKLRISGYQ